MVRSLPVVVDSHLRLPPGLPRDFERALRAEFRHSNPDYFKRKNLGFSTWNVPKQIRTTSEWFCEEQGKKALRLPRGGVPSLREIADAHGFRARFTDHRTEAPVDFPTFVPVPKDPSLQLYAYQIEAVAACIDRQQGIIRSPTGSGKTTMALALAHLLCQRGLVIVRDTKLLKQWIEMATASFGMTEREIGIVGSGKNRHGDRLTLAMQQSLYSKGDKLDQILQNERYGFVIIDEVQTVAAKTFLSVVDRLPMKYRIGFSADETRKDRKEFLIYDVVGPVLYEIERQELEQKGVIHPVDVRVIPTEFAADWYAEAENNEKDWDQFLFEMIDDDERNGDIVTAIETVMREGQVPAFIFTHRREHARLIADELMMRRRYPCGLLIGSKEDEVRFNESIQKLHDGTLAIAAGTFNSIGTGINLPTLQSGIIATPLGNNPQFFNQVRGRLCRSSAGKSDAVLYYLWDREVYPDQLKRLIKWNDGRVKVRDGAGWIPARKWTAR